MQEQRVDKWLWSVRVFKTRTVATDACKRGRVTMGGALMKPSRTVKDGDVVEVRRPPVTYSFRVLGCPGGRVGAKLVPQYMENITPPSQLALLDAVRIGGFVNRRKGLGRPTKREARDLAAFTADMGGDEGWDFGDLDILDEEENED